MRHIDDEPARWRGRAESARTTADHMRNSEARLTMLEIAKAYDVLARQAQGRDDKE
jgi:hypothetical protein